MGTSVGKTKSLSISTVAAIDGGGTGAILRIMPQHIARSAISRSSETSFAFSLALGVLSSSMPSLSARAILNKHATYAPFARSSSVAGGLSSVRTYKHCAIKKEYC